MRPWTSRTLKS